MAIEHRRKPFTGWHMLAVLVAFFGVVIAVNVTMARLATSTFGGVVVENSYVASQEFNDWLDEAEKEKALGWTAVTTRQTDNRLSVALQGVPQGASVTALAKHPLGQQDDIAISFSGGPNGNFQSREALPAGRWILRMTVQAGGQTWRHQEELR